MQRRKRGVFYGWWIVVATCVSLLFNSMVYSYGLGIFYKRLLDDFGWTRASLAGAVSLSRLEAGALGGIEGVLVDRYGPRVLVLIGMPLMALGFIMLSRINSLFEFYLFFVGLVVIGQSLSHNIPFDTTIANWFIRRRGTAFGLIRSATAVGGGGAIITAWFIAQYGWRAAFVAAGIGTFVIGVPVALALRHRPEHYGLRPDGDTRETRANPGTATGGAAGGPSSSATVAAKEEDIGMPVREALRTRAFWAISLGFAIRVGATSTVTLHAVPLVEDLGYSQTTAAAVLSSVGLISLIGRLGGGVLSDLIGTKLVAVASVFLVAVSFLVLSQAQTMWQIWLFVAIYAPSYGASAAAMPAIKGDYFGRRSFGVILGLSGLIQTPGSMFGPVFAGYIYDVTKSYRLAFLILAGLLLVPAALFMSLGRPRYSRSSLSFQSVPPH